MWAYPFISSLGLDKRVSLRAVALRLWGEAPTMPFALTQYKNP